VEELADCEIGDISEARFQDVNYWFEAKKKGHTVSRKRVFAAAAFVGRNFSNQWSLWFGFKTR
jgi:hypothetical protein